MCVKTCGHYRGEISTRAIRSASNKFEQTIQTGQQDNTQHQR